MPKVVSYTPSWLSHPAPGARIFSDPEKPSPASPTKTRPSSSLFNQSTSSPSSSTRPRRIIAHRGSEVFTVVGNKIRWADLERVQDRWETKDARKSDQQHEQSDDKVYRTLVTSIFYEITNLIISPSGHFLAICTEHSINIASLPSSSRLQETDLSDIKLKTVQLARTTHIIGAAPLASVLWHPYAASSPQNDCLVTVTTDAVVRLWEFSRSNFTSYDQPTLALSIQQLANAKDTSNNVRPKPLGTNRGFSVDEYDFQVASACFGGQGMDNEDPWAPMTLWVAMVNTDVYAICPLLPEVWRPIATTIPALTTSAVAQISNTTSDDLTTDEKVAADQRYIWAQELDNFAPNATNVPLQEPSRQRPSAPSAIPRLQGPFELSSGTVDDDDEIVDIFVIPANLDEDDLFGDDESDILSGTKSLPFSILCLTTSSNQLHILLELDGVVGQWLPRKSDPHFTTPGAAPGQYVLLETLSLDAAPASPIITPDLSNPYAFYITSGSSIYFATLQEWANKIGQEVMQDTLDGMSSRLKLACSGSICTKSQILTHPSDSASTLSIVVLIENATLGTLVLSTFEGRAVAAQLDQARTDTQTAQSFRTSQSLMQILHEDEVDPLPTRAPYTPSPIFYSDPMASLDTIKSHIPAVRRGLLTQSPMRLSPACLDIITVAHRTFSQQTSAIEKATSELFRRCVRLREELADQVKAMSELEGRLRSLVEDEDGEPVNPNQRFESRISAAQDRQKDLMARYEKVRRRVAAAGPHDRPLSVNETAWINEVKGVARNVGVPVSKEEPSAESLASRLERAKELSTQLKEEAARVKEQQQQSDGSSTPRGIRSTGGYMSRFQREKIKEAMEMVEREAAIIQAVEGRLAKLTV